MPSTDWPATWGAPPLHATPRNPSRTTDGPLVGVIAENLGTPFLPWQQYVSDVANERRADGSFEYQVVVVSVPRQCGKTTLIRAEGVHSCLVSGRDVFYTAQSGKDARARWVDLVKALRLNDALKDRIKVALRGGSESVTFPGGAEFRVFAPTPESLHGYTPPRVFLDEVFSYTPAEGELLMGAIGPAQITIRDKQIWIVSTAGTALSTFLHDWIDRAVEGAPRVAGFIWGATDDQDPYSLEDIADFHPGVGFTLNGKVLEASDVLEQVERNTRAEYERAYANRRTLTTSNLITPESWHAMGPSDLRPFRPAASTRELVLTYDVAHDRQAAAIVATWLLDGTPHVKVVRAEPGVAWLADAVADLDATWRPAVVAAVDNGPVLDVTTDLLERGLAVDVLREREYATACGAFLTRVDDGALRHDGAKLLEASATGLVTRGAVGDGVAFSRRHSVGNAAPAVAVVAGVWAADRLADAAPLIDFG